MEHYRNLIIKLLTWFEKAGRHDLPWRNPATPYRVLISELMLQQTTVTTIRPRFEHWMKQFPDISSLAQASEAELLAAWQGLGYYARARRLHQLAKVIAEEHQGKIPSEPKLLHALPGIGPYTTAALQSFAFGKATIALDTNIIRVLARTGNITEAVDTKEGKERLQEEVTNWTEETTLSNLPKKYRSKKLTAALMDLGALICTARNPSCLICPLQEECQATDPSSLPRQKPRPVITHKKEKRLLLQPTSDTILLEHSQGPHWKGLWILPLLPHDFPAPSYRQKAASLIYPITRYRITMELYRASLPSQKDTFSEKKLQPFPLTVLKEIALPSPHRKILQKLFPQQLPKKPF